MLGRQNSELTDSPDPVDRLDAIARALADPAGAEFRSVQLKGMPVAPVLAVEGYLTDLSRELAVRSLDPACDAASRDDATDGALSPIGVILAMFGPYRRQIVAGAEEAGEAGDEVFDITLELPFIAKEAAILFGDLLAQLQRRDERSGLQVAPMGQVPRTFFSWFLTAVIEQLGSRESVSIYEGPIRMPGGGRPRSPRRRGKLSTLIDAVHASRSFPLSLDSPRDARQFVGEQLRSWDLQDHAERAMLPVSELVTNVMVHAQTQAIVEVMSALGQSHVGVRDFSPDRPRPRHYEPRSPFGRGLWIVDQSVNRWGVEPLPGGKSVWFARPGRWSTSAVVASRHS